MGTQSHCVACQELRNSEFVIIMDFPTDHSVGGIDYFLFISLILHLFTSELHFTTVLVVLK